METNTDQPNSSEAIIKNYKKAGFLLRFNAFVIDTIISIILYIISYELLKSFQLQIPFLGLIVTSLYGAIFIWKYGATPGKMLFKLKVVSTSYQHVGFGSALLRESIGKWISGIVFEIGNLWILIDKKNQAWHDKIAHTYVVKVDEKGMMIHAESDETVSRKRKVTFWVLLFANPFTIAFIFIFIYIFLFRPVEIRGNTMEPNYLDGQYYLTSINHGMLNRGDVIIFQSPVNPERDLIKRIIGLPGDRVMVKDGDVYLNSQLLDESKYISQEVKTYGGSFQQDGQDIIVPEGSYFVLGDNRPYSSDSREWGFVPKADIISKAVMCYWKCSK